MEQAVGAAAAHPLDSLNAMADGMAKVQAGALALLVLIVSTTFFFTRRER